MNSQQYNPLSGQPPLQNSPTPPVPPRWENGGTVQPQAAPEAVAGQPPGGFAQPPQGYPQQNHAHMSQPPISPGFAGVNGVQPAPVFIQGGWDKNPQRTAAVKSLNGTAMICLSQTVLGFIWEILFLLLFGMLNKNVLRYGFSVGQLNWMNAVMVPLCTFFPAVIYTLKNKLDLTEHVRFEHRNGLCTALGIFFGFGICLLANYPAGVVDQILQNFGLNALPTGPNTYDPSSTWVYIFAVAILAPIFEEFVFRGIILTRLERYGKGFAIIGSALIFGIAHSDLSRFAFAFIAGLVFGFLYVKTRNIWVPIAVHFLNNSLAMAQNTLSHFVPDSVQTIINLISLAVPIFIGLLAGLLLLLLRRREFFTLREPQEVQQDPHGLSIPKTGLSAGNGIGALLRSAGLWVITAGMFVLTIYFRLPRK